MEWHVGLWQFWRAQYIYRERINFSVGLCVHKMYLGTVPKIYDLAKFKPYMYFSSADQERQ